MRAWVIRLIPVVIPALTIFAWAVVFIRLGCEGQGCVNVTEWQNMTAPRVSPVQAFLNLWEI